MPGLRIFTSNRLEVLAKKLSEILQKPLFCPFTKEIIIVQSMNMAKWISLELAQKNAICANMSFPFPNTFVNQIFFQALPCLLKQPLSNISGMTWELMNILPKYLKREGFEDLKAYLDAPCADLKKLQLAQKIADTFNQYLIYRPEMILEWGNEQEKTWQAVLFRELLENNRKPHLAAQAKAFYEMIDASSNRLRGLLPKRVSAFGISALPPFHLKVLAALGKFSEVNLFLMNPCREYWGVKKRDAKNKDSLSTKGPCTKNGNSLLSAWGILGRDFFDMIDKIDSKEETCFEEPRKDFLLNAVQSDILCLRQPANPRATKKPVNRDDLSIQIHSCHSPIREIEVLHDQILAMFDADEDLTAEDIFVMMPDINFYAPYIRAVFNQIDENEPLIPFNIANQDIKGKDKIFEAFFKILDFSNSRLTAPKVTDLLKYKAVRRRFGMDSRNMDIIYRWVRETGIRWAIDEQDRYQMGLPGSTENTWQMGLKRLILGYAMHEKNSQLFQDILPYGPLEGQEAVLLGNFYDFIKQLVNHVKSMKSHKTLEEWNRTLIKLLDDFFLPEGELDPEIESIRRALIRLNDIHEISGFQDKIDIKAVKWYLERLLKQDSSGFMIGTLTFSSMLPMRAIPYKIICILGMDNNAYPRQSPEISFDLIAKNPRQGDYSLSLDDRYLFLETLLSARKRLYISYVGQDIRDNNQLDPSILVSDLLDYIEQGYWVEGSDICKHILIRHPLQPFSPAYFRNNEKLFSYSKEYLDAAKGLAGHRKIPLSFFHEGLKPSEGSKELNLSDLAQFFVNPARFLLKEGLGIDLKEQPQPLEETESFTLKGLDKYLIEEDLVKKSLEDYDLKIFLPSLKAAGKLPHGTVGDCYYRKSCLNINAFVEKTGHYLKDPLKKPLAVDLLIGGIHLKGKIGSIYSSGMTIYRYGIISPKDHLKAWISHLVLNAIKPENYPCTTFLIGLATQKGKNDWAAWKYPPLEESLIILEELLLKYQHGMCKPLHFFPKSSWKYAHMIKKGKPSEEALERARNEWLGNEFQEGESSDQYFSLCFKAMDPLDNDFQRISQDIFAPIFKYKQKIA